MTLNGDLAEDAGVARQSAAVPATVAKLFRTLSDGEVRAVRDAHHHVRVKATQAALLTRQAGNVVADRARTHPDRQHAQRLLTQRPAHELPLLR